MQKRTYVKRSEYWNQPRKNAMPPITINTAAPETTFRPSPMPDIIYGSTQVATAGSVPPSSADTRGRQLNDGSVDPGAYQNLRALPLPFFGYNGQREYTGMANSIDLCARAWVGVPVIRNAIETSVEFSNQPLSIKTTNQTVKTFFNEWFNAIQIGKLKEQFFREYYRSGNVFLYKFDGKFGPAYYKGLQQSFGTKNNKIAIRYELLNPTNIFVPTGLVQPYTYVRLLSTYEVDRLRNPITEQDKQVYNSLPPQVKAQIRNSSSNPIGIYIPLEGERLRYAFYKKQSYEPLAVPMVWPVLADVEWKLALKKMDMALARTIEHAILLVTTGEAPSKENGGNGINPNNIVRLQALFSNQTINRVLVADYTTKVTWAIPDIKDVLGPEKYHIVDADIKDGLQSIMSGGDKFANAQIKAKIFIQRLEEGQAVFLNDFLMPEIISICENMGFRQIPIIKFKKIDLQDAAVMSRVYTQMAQFGLLTPDELNVALETGILPDQDESKQNQLAYKADRKKGLYEPLAPAQQGQDGRPPGTGTPQTTKKISPMGTSKASTAFSVRAYADHLRAGQDLLDIVTRHLCKKAKVKSLDERQSLVANTIAKTVIALNPMEKWNDIVTDVIVKPPTIPAAIAKEIDDIRTKYDVDEWDATILHHCKTSGPDEIRD